ncbi:hypothetical protein COCNU_09G002520 [Cocos nucifera]|uniref:Uncharacterized protein n=1 Tax=Cocos nucifera TaxID=13894 RepID=A0A8K0IJV8_COCNU|nr:hypothetical protein COCNU_09G002520 [Cocos nucifera]
MLESIRLSFKKNRLSSILEGRPSKKKMTQTLPHAAPSRSVRTSSTNSIDIDGSQVIVALPLRFHGFGLPSQLMHNIAHLSEVVIGFNARSELLAIKEWIVQLKGFLVVKYKLIERQQKRIIELEEKLQLKQAEAEEKLKSLEARGKANKVKIIAKAKVKAIKEYKALGEFKVEIIEGSSVAYGYGFDACKA